MVLAGSLAAQGQTFTRDVAPILQARCQECHRPGRPRRFRCSLMSRRGPGRRRSKRRCCSARCRRGSPIRITANSRTTVRCQQSEIDTLVAWVDAGAPQGDPKDMPPPRAFADGWAIPKPDAVIELPTPYRDPGDAAPSSISTS